MKIIVDAMNIAFRAHHVYDVKQQLSTEEGFPTGIIYGFMKILAGWKKKYPQAEFHIAWDSPGALESRRAIVPEYKANRTARPVDDEGVNYFGVQIPVLREILPHLGISQYSLPATEADDVIAHLVRDQFQYNSDAIMILSSDRDLLQLVSPRTVLMTPEGKVYDEEKVLEEYGVPPTSLLQLRAMFGDTSDNLKGLPRFRKKVAARLVTEYKDVDSIYNQDPSVLELTKTEHKKLIEHEQVVRNNLRVMGFQEITDPLEVVVGCLDEGEFEERCKALEFTRMIDDLLYAFDPPQGLIKYAPHTTS